MEDKETSIWYGILDEEKQSKGKEQIDSKERENDNKNLTIPEKIILADWFLSKAEITFIDFDEYNICLEQEVSWLKDEKKDEFNEIPRIIAKHQWKSVEEYYKSLLTEDEIEEAKKRGK